MTWLQFRRLPAPTKRRPGPRLTGFDRRRVSRRWRRRPQLGPGLSLDPHVSTCGDDPAWRTIAATDAPQES